MNFKTTIFLLVLVLLVGGYFFFVDRKAPTTQEQNETAAQQTGSPGTSGTPLFTADKLSTEAVQTVTIEADGKKIVLQKNGADWSQVEPVHFPVNTWSVQTIIDDTAGLRYTRKLAPGEKDAPSLEKLELAPPKATVTLTTGGDKPATFTVKVGRTTLGNQGFVMVANDPAAYVVNDALHKLIQEQKPDAWRRKTVQAPTEAQAGRVSLTRNGQTVEVIKSDGNWSLGPPHSGRADSKAITSLLNGIVGIYIDKFIADAPADLSAYGLDKPSIVLTVTLPPPPAASQPTTKPGAEAAAKPTIKTLRIGSPLDLTKESYYATWDDGDEAREPGRPGPGHYAEAGGSGAGTARLAGGSGNVVFTIPKTDIEKFNKTVDDLRDPRITPLAAADVREVTIQRSGGDAVRLVRGPGGWDFASASGIPGSSSNLLTPAVGFKADNDEVSKLIDSIVDAKTEAYRTFSPAAATTPDATVTLTAIGKSEPDVLRIYSAASKNKFDPPAQWLVVRNNETTGYLVPADKLTAPTVTPLALRDRVVLDLPKDRINRVVINQKDGTQLTFERTVPPTTKPAGTKPATRPAAPPVPGAWTLTTTVPTTEPGKKTPVHTKVFETAAFDRLLDEFSPLRAEKWLPEMAGMIVDSILPVEITTADGQTRRITFPNNANQAARMNGLGASFQVSKGLIDDLNGEFRDRTVLPIAALDIKEVAITRDGKTAKVHKDDDGKYVSADDQKINQAAAGALFDTLAGLRVEHYLEDRSISKPGLVIEVQMGDGKKEELSLQAAGLGEDEVWMSGSFWSGRARLSKEVVKKLDADLIEKNLEKDKGSENGTGAAE